MPPQKNSGNKAAKRETGASVKNRDFINSFLYDTVKEGDVENVYLARILKKFGNGRVQVFFIDAKEKPQVVQGVIRGTFTGKAKKSIWIEDNAIVLVADSTIVGPGQYEIMAVLNHDQVREVKKVKPDLDKRILALDITDPAQLMSKNAIVISSGFDFDASDDIAEEIPGEEVATQPNARRVLKELTKDDIDNI
jgi:hypothetical protein